MSVESGAYHVYSGAGTVACLNYLAEVTPYMSYHHAHKLCIPLRKGEKGIEGYI